MNDAMYEHAATRANLETLRARGVEVLEPGTGALGSPGEWGVGRLPEPAELLAAVEARLGAAAGGSLDGLKVLVTAGGTREPIDAVRFVGNRSSGKMGWALAEEAARRGAQRHASSPPTSSLPRAPGIEYVDVATAAELAAACAERFPAADVLLMAAAVADYRPASRARGQDQEDRGGGDAARSSSSAPRTCSARSPPSRRPGQLLVGFAAESGDGALAYARDKLERKRLDAVVVNDVSRAGIAFDAPDNEVTIVTADGEQHVPQASKAAVAGAVLDSVLSRRSSSRVRVEQLMEPVEPKPARGTVAAAEVQKAGRGRERGSRRTSGARSRSATRCSSTSSSRCSPRATSSSRTTRASARPRSRARSRARSTRSSRASSARPTCCRPTSSAPTSTTSASSASSSGPARSSRTS